MKEVGTLKELGVKPGDVVEDKCGANATVVMHNGRLCVLYPHWDDPEERNEYDGYRIISRASDTPKTWGADEGWSEWTSASEWNVSDHDVQMECVDGIHRVRTRPRIRPEPKRETVTIYGAPTKHVQWCLDICGLDTHRITFDLIDGEPDCSSVKMEQIT